MSIDPNKTALLSMDFQNGVVGMVDDSDSLIARQKQAIETARKKGVTIAHVRVAFADGEAPAGQMGKRIPPEMIANFHADSPNTQHHDELAPAPGDIAVRKVRVGPFSTTDLHEQLQAKGIDTLIITGIATSGVVLSAVRDAHDKDYELIVVSDLCADRDDETHRVLTEKVIANQAEVIDSNELLKRLS